MNRIYRLVWSRTQQAWVPVSEISGGLARGGNKSTRSKLLAASLTLCSAMAQASPSGGEVTAGAGTIAQTGTTTTIHQNSQNLSLNWQSFNIATKEIVNFVQPSAAAIAVNRIFDTSATQILGQLNANGQVYLINPNGIIFGQGSQVNVGGLVASTLEVSDANLTSTSKTFSGKGTGNIVNKGSLVAATGGYIALLANQVSNQGIISAQLGTVALVGGSAMTLTFADNSLVQVQVNQSTLNNLAENKQLVVANGGQVFMDAGAKASLLASVVNNTGIIEAQTVSSHEGVISLMGGMEAGTVNVAGTLDASAPNGGNGGAIETSAANVKVFNNTIVNTSAHSGNVGNWLIDPADFTIGSSTTGGTITGSTPSGDISGATLSNALKSSSVTIQSNQGSTANGIGNINVNDAVSWSANQLTLDAQNNININATMSGTSSASLALNYGLNALALSNTSQIITNGGSVSLPTSTTNFTTTQGSDGVPKNYTVINSLGIAADSTSAPTSPSLQGMAAIANLATNYVLGSNIDASATSTWNSAAGFTPIGASPSSYYSGSFNGFGHTINGLNINRPSTQNVGLFGNIGNSSNSTTITNIGLIGVNVIGDLYVGGLTGSNSGTLSNTYVTGSVTGNSNVGGLAGSNSGTITNSYANASVTGVTGTVSSNLGGLVGYNGSSINNSYANGSVSGNTILGGLVGNNSGSISNSYAANSVTGNTTIGGLVGINTLTISNSFYNKDINSTLTGIGSGGAADSAGSVWGLSTNAMSDSTQNNFTSSTTANGNSNPGWNFSTTWGINSAINGGNPYLLSIAPHTTIYLDLIPGGFSVYGQTPSYTLYTGSGTPTAGTYFYYTSATYGNGTVITDASPIGSINWSGAPTSTSGVGSYSLTYGSGISLGNSGYRLAAGNAASWSVAPANLTLSGTMTYNGTTNLAGIKLTATGVNGETFAMAGSASLSNANVQTKQALVNVTNLVLGTGNTPSALASNYNALSTTGSSVNVTKANLILKGSQVYNGTATLEGTNLTAIGVNGETFKVNGTGVANLSSTKVQTNKPLANLSDLTLGAGNNGSLATNYNGLSITGSSINVTKANLILNGTKVYNGTTTLAGKHLTAIGINGETFKVNGTGVANLITANTQTNQPLAKLSDLTLGTGNTSSALASNYNPLSIIGSSVNVNSGVTPIFLDLIPGSSVYGQSPQFTYAFSDSAIFGSVGSKIITDASPSGTITWSGAPSSISGVRLSPYSVQYRSGITLGNDAYQLYKGNAANWTITPATLKLSGTQVYNGSTTLSGSHLKAIGVNGQTFSVTGTGVGNLSNANVQTNQALANVTNLALGTGNTSAALAGNYNPLSTTGSSINVTKANLILKGTKVYNGTTTLAGTNLKATGVNGETFAVTGTGVAALSTANVKTNQKLANVTNLSLGSSINGGNSSNYNGLSTASSLVNVTKANLLLYGTKRYDGSADLAGTNLTAIGVNGETFKVNGTGKDDLITANTQTNQPLAKLSDLTLGTGNTSTSLASNYNPLSITGSSVNVIPGPMAIYLDLIPGSSIYGQSPYFTYVYNTSATSGNGTTILDAAPTGTIKWNNAPTSTSGVGTYNPTYGSGITLGNNAYTLYAGNTANWSITPAALTLSGTQVYNGTTTIAGSHLTATGVNGQTFSVTGTGVGDLSNANVQTNQNLANVTNLSLGSSTNGGQSINYKPLSTIGSSVNVTKANLILSGSQVYNGMTTLAGDKLTAKGANGETFAVTGTGVNNLSTANVQTNQNLASVYNLSLGSSSNGGQTSNYNALSAKNSSVSVTPVSLTVKADKQTRLYGAVNPTFTETITGFVYGQNSTVVSGTANGISTTDSKTDIGSYVIKASSSGLSARNYIFGTLIDGNLTITPAPLTVTANNQTRLYGAVDPTFTETITGFVNNDNISVVSGTATARSAATQITNVGTSVISASNSNLSATNYSFKNLVNGTLTITPATLTVTADKQTRLYGAANPTLTGTVTGFVNRDTLTNATTSTEVFSTSASPTNNVGQYGITGSGLVANNGNYNFVQASTNNSALSITPATLKITANNQTRLYGAANPVFTETITGFLNGDYGTAYGTSTANLTTSVGSTSVIKASSNGLISPNYIFGTMIDAKLTITPAPLTVTADNQTRLYGAINPNFTQKITGFLNGEDSSVVTGSSTLGSSTATSTTNIGTSVITASNSGLSATNYNFNTLVNGALTITPATLTVTADKQTRLYGSANPTLTGTVTGFVNSDTLTNATKGTQVFSSPAKITSNVGQYGITGSGLVANNSNYNFVQAGTNTNALSITPANLTVTADSKTRLYGGLDPTFTETISGFVNGDSSSVVSGKATGINTATSLTNVGSSIITATSGTLSAANYNFTNLVNGTLTITPATLNVIATAATQVYGASTANLATLKGKITGFVNDQDESVLTGTQVFNVATSYINNIGQYGIVGSGLVANNGNYIFVQDPLNSIALTITPATLNIIATPTTQVYGAKTPTLTGTVTGFVNDDTLATATTGSVMFSTTASPTSNVGTYGITGNGLFLNNGNYTILQDAANSSALAITKASLTLSGSGIYSGRPTLAGSNLTANGVNGQSFSVSGTGDGNLNTANVQTNQALANLSDLALGTGNSSTALASNYNSLSTIGSSVSVTPATLTVTADNQTRLYGGVNPTFTETITGFVNGETNSIISGTGIGISTVTKNSGVGSSLITASNSGLSAPNYNFNNLVNGAFSITPATLTVTADNQTRLYGAVNPTFTETITGFINGDDSSVVSGKATGNSAANSRTGVSSVVGTTTINASNSGLFAANYNFNTLVNGTLTITPAKLTVTADNQTRLYGAANPIFTETISGFANGDTANVTPTGISDASSTTGVGSSVITASSSSLTLSGSNASNYYFGAAVNGNLTITPAPLTFIADNQTRLYGANNPLLTGNVSGFVNSDTLTNTTTGAKIFSTTATSASNVGQYAIIGSGLSLNNGNYTFVQAETNNSALSITPANLTVTADKQTRSYGAANPIFTQTITGFVNNENRSVVSGIAYGSSTADSFTTVGSSSTIIPSKVNLSATNYNFTNLVSDTLTITPAILNYIATPVSYLYGTNAPALIGSITGFVNGDKKETATTGTEVFNVSASHSLNVGHYGITGSGLVSKTLNYIFMQDPANSSALSIAPVTLNVLANPVSQIYGANTPTLSGTVTGFINNETLASATTGTEVFSTTASNKSNVGQYAITGAGLVANNGNYIFVQDGANNTALTITPATLTVTANSLTRMYGAANPTFTETITGFLNNDNSSVVSGTALGSNTTNLLTGVGTSVITASSAGLNASNYIFGPCVNGTLTINPAILTVTADNQTRLSGVVNPTFNQTITGFLNNENSSVVSGTAYGSCAANSTTGVGNSTIFASNSGLSALNYNFNNLVNGILTIK